MPFGFANDFFYARDGFYHFSYTGDGPHRVYQSG
jgi:hypothetical protein